MAARRSRGVLPVIAGLFILSGVVRLVGDAAPALAQGLADGPDAAVAGDDPDAEPRPPADMPDALVQALRQREDRVAAREAQIADRMQALAVAEAEIAEQIEALTEAEESLSEMISQASTAAEDDLARLTEVYQNMKPQEAAALFAQMEPVFSAGFMGRMQPEAAAAIMSNLDPQTAYLISVVLAGRNAAAPNE